MQLVSLLIGEKIFSYLSPFLKLLNKLEIKSSEVLEMEKSLKAMRFIANKATDRPKVYISASEIKNALVVSKQSLVRYQLKDLLNNKDVSFSLTENMYMALGKYKQKLHDLIVIDNTIEQSNLMEIVRKIKDHSYKYSHQTTIIMITSSINKIDKARLISYGVDEFIEEKEDIADEINCVINAIASSMKKVEEKKLICISN